MEGKEKEEEPAGDPQDPRLRTGRARGRPPSTSSVLGPGMDHLKIEPGSAGTSPISESTEGATAAGPGTSASEASDPAEVKVKPEIKVKTEPGDVKPGFPGKREDETKEERQKRWDIKREQRRIKEMESYDAVVSRPEGQIKEGGAGEPIQLSANYVQMQRRREWALYHYHASFTPELERTKDKKEVMRPFGGTGQLGAFIFDGHSLWCVTKLTADPAAVLKLDGSLKDGTKIAVEVKLVAQLIPGDVMYMQFYGILVRKCLAALKLDQMGRHFFDCNAAIKMHNHHLELWPGFITTIRQHEAGLLYCVEITHKVIRTDSVLHMMTQRKQEMKRMRDCDMTMIKAAIAEELIGTIVMTEYNRRTYRVDDIAWDETANSTFPRENQGEISYMAYFKDRYKIEITVENQPLLISKPKKEDIRRGHKTPYKLIPELCKMTGLSNAMRANFGLMKDMGFHMFQPPAKKIETIKSFIARIRGGPALTELHSWGMNMTPNLVEFTGRVLPRENIAFGGNSLFEANDKADFTMAFRKEKMVTSIALRTWVIIVPGKDESNIANLVGTMQRVARPLGFDIGGESEKFSLRSVGPDAYVEAVTKAMNKYGRELQMVFVVLPNNKLDTYAAVKKRCYIDFGLSSQCFLSKNVASKGLMSIATKVVVQMNAKLGGEPWHVRIPLASLMIIGFDVYHGGGSSRSASIGAMTCTTNESFGRFFSTVSLSGSREELSTNMALDVAKCCNAFRKKNQGSLPGRIIFYRDGVGEGQLTFVFNTELEAIKTQLEQLYKSAQLEPPKFTFIVVTKRINTRVFRMVRGGYENPPPGTIVDSAITIPERWDFFLVAPSVRQGVVSPTMYNVLWDRNGLDADKIQRLTFKLCHLYYNWSGTVAVPAVCQFAHKLAYLTGMATKKPNNPYLSFLLYFL